MIRFIESPDIHADPAWIETTERQFDAIREASIRNDVDFVLFPGDLHNRHFVDSDKSGITRIRNKIKQQLEICPIGAIEGTKSHDAPGSYDTYERMGLVLMRPGNVYGYGKAEKQISIFSAGIPHPDAILFGINELNTENIHSSLQLSAAEANAAAERLFEEHIDSYIAPTRLNYPQAVAIGMLHGVVSDARRENSTDRIVRSSAIVTYTETLARAGLDRWSLGDQHIPWESSVCSAGYAGYAGIDDHVWNYLDFVPAMNLIEISEPGATPKITRIPYGLPERRKVYTLPANGWAPGVSYWLETDDPNTPVPEGTRVTTKTTTKVERRIQDTQKEYTLPELFKLYDPAVSESVIEKVNKLSVTAGATSTEPINVQVLEVEIFGCIFFKSKHIKLDISALANGLTGIGYGNGVGKSSILSFCSPYPLTVARMPESGHVSAIKEFFDGQDSRILKRVSRNGIEHRHEIHIKGAHTNSASVECYLFINGENVLSTKTFATMMEKCIELYGSFEDYFATTWVAQPFSGQGSGLMDAKKTEARNVVMNIAGKGRDTEKDVALENVRLEQKKYDEKSAWIAGASEFMLDPEVLRSELPALTTDILSCTNQMDAATEKGKQQKALLDSVRELKSRNDTEIQRRENDQNRSIVITDALENKRVLVAKLKENESLLAKHEENARAKDRNATKKIAYDSAVNAWNAEYATLKQSVVDLNAKINGEWQSAKNDILTKNTQAESAHSQTKSNYESQKTRLESQIQIDEQIKFETCPQCGYIAPDAQEKLEAAQSRLLDNRILLAAMFPPTPPILEAIPDEPIYEPIPNPATPLPSQPEYELISDLNINEQQLRSDIESARTANADILALESEVARLLASSYTIDETIQSRLNETEQEYTRLQTEYTEARSKLSMAQQALEQKKLAITKAEESKAAIDQARTDLQHIESDLQDWKTIAKYLQEGAIPAMELEQSLDIIDTTATNILKPFLQGQYTIRTQTVPNFDIIVYDSETGGETSFFKKNQGHKAFFADAYTKALIQRRNERQHRDYSPIIYDEADAPIEPARISMYYDMQDAYFSGRNTKVLVVSQKDPAYIQNRIDIKDLIV